MAQTVAERQEMLTDLALLAQDGVRQIIVIGKTTRSRSFPAKDGREAVTLCEVVIDEGKSMAIKYPIGKGPDVGHEGAYLVANPSEYQRQAQADGLAFA